MTQKDVYSNPAEKIFDLCKKFANRTDGKIVLSHDNDNFSSATAALCASAIAFSNRQCMYFKNQPQFITRCAVRTYCASGGVHIYINEDSNICMTFIDENGKNSDFCGGKTEVEATFPACTIVPMLGYKFHYERQVVKECENIRLGYKILVSAKNTSVRETTKNLLAELDCEYSFYTEKISKNNQAILVQFGKTVKNGGYDIGIIIGAEGETAILADENGEIICEREFDRLCIMVERQVMCVLTDKRCKPDAIGGIIKILDYMKSNKQKLSEIVKQRENSFLPEY